MGRVNVSDASSLVEHAPLRALTVPFSLVLSSVLKGAKGEHTILKNARNSRTLRPRKDH